MKVWWCNQGHQWDVERIAGVVCSSESTNPYRKNVGRVRKGDIIAHYTDSCVVAFSQAKQNGRRYKQLPVLDGDDYGAGWRCETEYFCLRKPLRITLLRNDLVSVRQDDYPIGSNGNVREGYLFPFNLAGLRLILGYVKEPTRDWLEEIQRPS